MTCSWPRTMVPMGGVVVPTLCQRKDARRRCVGVWPLGLAAPTARLQYAYRHRDSRHAHARVCEHDPESPTDPGAGTVQRRTHTPRTVADSRPARAVTKRVCRGSATGGGQSMAAARRVGQAAVLAASLLTRVAIFSTCLSASFSSLRLVSRRSTASSSPRALAMRRRPS
jgi:hypothetical protein